MLSERCGPARRAARIDWPATPLSKKFASFFVKKERVGTRPALVIQSGRRHGETGVTEVQVMVKVAEGVVRELSFSHDDDVTLEKSVRFMGRE